MFNARPKALIVSLLAFTVVLAGCVGDDATSNTDSSKTDTPDQPADLGNNGAIRGLVVDDNFRPVQLKEEWGTAPGDYQDVGFVLVLETGQRFETNENGEFTVAPLKPGTYTLRVAADVHEAKDALVSVVAGEYAEVTVEARRQYSGGGTVISQEEVIFVACAVATTVVRMVQGNGCGDLSGDSGRYGFMTDYSAFAADIRGMVTEIRVHQEGYHGTAIRYEDCEHEAADSVANGCVYAEFDVIKQERWGKAVLYPDLQRLGGWERNFEEPAEYLQEGEEGYCHPRDSKPAEDCLASGTFGRYFAWDPTQPFRTILFPDHPDKQHQDALLEPLQPTTCTFDDTATIPWVSGTTTVGARVRAYLCDGGGNGIIIGTKAQYLQNVFLYELPDEGIEDYCALCEDADIPE